MSDRLTSIRLPGIGAGLAEWGRETPSHMIELYRRYARSELEKAQAVLAAPDEAFEVETYTGVQVRRNREVLQSAKAGGQP